MCWWVFMHIHIWTCTTNTYKKLNKVNINGRTMFRIMQLYVWVCCYKQKINDTNNEMDKVWNTVIECVRECICVDWRPQMPIRFHIKYVDFCKPLIIHAFKSPHILQCINVINVLETVHNWVSVREGPHFWSQKCVEETMVWQPGKLYLYRDMYPISTILMGTPLACGDKAQVPTSENA